MAIILGWMIFATSPTAHAHPEGFSGLQVTVEAQSLRASLTLHTRDFDRWFPARKYNDYVNDVCRELERTVAEVLDVQVDGKPLQRESVTAKQIEVGLIEVDVRWKLPAIEKPAELLIWSKHLIQLPRDHQQLLFVDDRRLTPASEKAGTVILEDILTAERDAATTELLPVSLPSGTRPARAETKSAPESHGDQSTSTENATPADGAARTPKLSDSPTPHANGISFFLLGIEHILTGYDHLLFLAALLLTTASLREAATIITCFTVAHSVTLALAALDVVSLPGEIVEPAIAASIVYVAIENLWTKPVVWRRAIVTFLFGLIHGLGFASVLKDIGLGRLPGGVVWPLVRFNLGVEAGQLAVAVVFLPVLYAIRRSDRLHHQVVNVASILVALCGAYWLVVRIFSH